MKKAKKKITIIVLSLCLLASNFFASIPKEKNVSGNNFNGDYILPNFIESENYNL